VETLKAARRPNGLPIWLLDAISDERLGFRLGRQVSGWAASASRAPVGVGGRVPPGALRGDLAPGNATIAIAVHVNKLVTPQRPYGHACFGQFGIGLSVRGCVGPDAKRNSVGAVAVKKPIIK